MKNKFLALIAILTLAFAACKKDNGTTPSPDKSGDYQPVTVGSTWKYRNTTINPFDPTDVAVTTTTNTMTAEMKNIGAISYHKLKSVTEGEVEESFMGYANNVYTFRYEDSAEDIAFDLPYLNDKLAVGDTFTTTLNAQSGVQARYVTTILEKGISKNIVSKNYQNVIHTKVELQYAGDGQWHTGLTFEFYAAKNIGLIFLTGGAQGTEITRTELLEHSIK